jgi:pyruvate/2-oxoglutarate dehydrogenase complex dihydrolipoamide acyltransferase (E2) component
MATLDKELVEVETEKLQLELEAVEDLIEELTF